MSLESITSPDKSLGLLNSNLPKNSRVRFLQNQFSKEVSRTHALKTQLVSYYDFYIVFRIDKCFGFIIEERNRFEGEWFQWIVPCLPKNSRTPTSVIFLFFFLQKSPNITTSLLLSNSL